MGSGGENWRNEAMKKGKEKQPPAQTTVTNAQRVAWQDWVCRLLRYRKGVNNLVFAYLPCPHTAKCAYGRGMKCGRGTQRTMCGVSQTTLGTTPV